MNIDFTNKVALITGATRGIGKSIAEKLRHSGARLILTGTDPVAVNHLAEDEKRNANKNVTWLQADFSSQASTSEFLIALKTFDRIDILINNAGINLISPLVETSDTNYDQILDVNLKAPYQLVKSVGNLMMKHNYGRIVNIASIWSVITRSGRSLYTMSKCGLVGMTRTLAVEWAPYNILVNAVSPGFTRTELTEKTNTVQQLHEIAAMIPLQRLAEPAEIANLTAFLSSDLNTYITGQNILIDGGFSNV